MSETLHRARQAVLDSSGIIVTLRITQHHSSGVWFEMIHPDQHPIPFAEHWTDTLYTNLDKHHIPFGDYHPAADKSISSWIKERAISHLNQMVSGIGFRLQPTGHVDSYQGEGFMVAIDGIKRLNIDPMTPGCSQSMQWIHWKHFFQKGDPRLTEIETRFAAWRQESNKK